MGCGLAKRKDNISLDLRMQISGDPRFDQLFEDVEAPIRTVLVAKQRLHQAYVAFQKEVGTYKQLKSPTFFDSVMAMLFCLSASGEGDLESIGFEHTATPPFITVNPSLLYPEHRKILPAWTHLIDLATNLPSELSTYKDQFEAAIVESSCKIYADFADNEVGVTSISTINSTKMMRTITANHEKLKCAPTVLGEVVDLAREITETMGQMGDILVQGGPAIVAVGRQAYLEQRLLPYEIVGKYWPTASPRPE